MTAQDWIAWAPLIAAISGALSTIAAVVIAVINKRSNDNALRAMQATLETKEERIAALKDQVSHVEAYGQKTMDLALREEDLKIRQLEGELRMVKLMSDQSLYRRVEQLSATIQANEADLQSYQAALGQAEEEKTELRVQTDAQNQEIDELRSRVEKAVLDNEQARIEVARLQQRAKSPGPMESLVIAELAAKFVERYLESSGELEARVAQELALSRPQEGTSSVLFKQLNDKLKLTELKIDKLLEFTQEVDVTAPTSSRESNNQRDPNNDGWMTGE